MMNKHKGDFKGTYSPDMDLHGKKFGKWTVESFSHTGPQSERFWNCICDCGTRLKIDAGGLRYGSRNQCLKCTWKETAVRSRKHGQSGGSKAYRAWGSMKQRCSNPYDPAYWQRIFVCDRWMNSFENFYEDMGDPPSPQHSLHRVDNDGNYEPENCIWATSEVQQNNRSDTKWIEFRGERRGLTEWCRILDLDRSAVQSRFRHGWSAERALTEPVKKRVCAH